MVGAVPQRGSVELYFEQRIPATTRLDARVSRTFAVGVASANSVAQTARPCTVRAGLSVRLAAHLLCQIHLAVDDQPQVSAAPAQLLDHDAAFRGHVFLLGGGRRLQDRYRLRRVVHRLVQTASGDFSRRF